MDRFARKLAVKLARRMRGVETDDGDFVHSAYWYASRHGWTVNTARTFTERYFEDVYHGLAGECLGYGGYQYRADPVVVCAHLAADLVAGIGGRVRETVVDPIRSGELRKALRRDYLRFRRPMYYAREAARRHALADARRRIRRRTTTAPMPTPDEVRAAWEGRRASKMARIRLGGMLHDLECYVDNRLRLDADGNIVGRNRGLKGWVSENLPDLLPHYKALMYYKELAMKLRRATDTHDPTPTAELLPDVDVPVGDRDDSAPRVNPGRIAEHGDGTAEGASEGRDAWRGMEDLDALRNMAKAESGVTGREKERRGELREQGNRRAIHAVVREIFEDSRGTATSILEILDRHLSPERIC